MASSSTSQGGSTSSATVSGDPCSSNEIDSESDLSSGREREVTSLLGRLKNPSQADIARLRKIKTNDPPRGKRRCRGALVSDPKGVSPTQ